MYSPSLFAAVPVALFLVSCANPSAALVVGNKHHASTKNKTMSALPNTRIGAPRRTRTKHVVAQPPQPQPQRRDVSDPLTANLEAYLSDLTLDHNNILAASDAFSSSARNARSNSDENSRQEVAEHLASYKETLGSLYPLFAHIGADKGLANYDKSDQYETLLKDIVNAIKNTLGGTSSLVDTIPVIGPLLGPIVYDIKCILDELLDLTENTTDELLNSLPSLLKPLILSATDTVCRSDIPTVAGICLPV